MYSSSGSTLVFPTHHVLCMFLLLILSFVILAAEAQNANCSTTSMPPCLGGRPLLHTGCCPRGAWQSCLPSRSLSCDEQLGLVCRDEDGESVAEGVWGECKGDSSLKVSSRGETMVDLTWTPFAPAGYEFEYVVLYKKGSYSSDVSRWEMREVGYTNPVVLRRLTPGTVYFVRAAVWENARAYILGNMTEAVMFQTRPVEFCIHEDENVLAGDELTLECEDRCVCLPTGQFQCAPLCPERGIPEIEEGCHVIQGENCCDLRVTCPIVGESCEVDSTTHNHGSTFTTNCRNCSCDHGEIYCDNPVECESPLPPEGCLNPAQTEDEDQCCPQWTCDEQSDEACVYEDESYSYLEYFSSDQCGLCQCRGPEGVRCAPDCPPVVMVVPDTACPDPHIRQDDCCETLHCHDPTTTMAQFLGRMFAMSYSPVTLTISFEVVPQEEVNEFPLYCTYEILFANKTDAQVTWQRRVVQPVDVRLSHDQADSHQVSSITPTPIDALTTDNAIVVGDRAYVTLAGMHPGTTYYVRIQPMLERSQHPTLMDSEGQQGGGEVAGQETAAMVVVKTMALENVTSCFYKHKELHHGQIAKKTCRETCICYYGEVTCVRNCEAEQFVMAKSPSCPKPLLVDIEGQCCPEWTCMPTESGCINKGTILTPGQSVLDGCDLCECKDGQVTCSSRCPPAGPAPRSGCSLVNVTGLCCPQWKCHVESQPPYGVKASIVLYLDQECQALSENFRSNLEDQLHIQVKSLCQENMIQGNNYCDSLQTKVLCHFEQLSSSNRRKRNSDPIAPETRNIRVQIIFFANFSAESPSELTIERLESESLHLSGVLNQSLKIETAEGQILSTAMVTSRPKVSHVCGTGFTYKGGQCVLSELETSVTRKVSAKMTVIEVSSSSVILTWEELHAAIVTHLTGLVIEYRLKGRIAWTTSTSLNPTQTSYLIQSLEPMKDYTVRLRAQSIWPDQSRWTLSQVDFQTTKKETDTNDARVQIEDITVLTDGAIITWKRQHSQIRGVEILWRASEDEENVKRVYLGRSQENRAALSGLRTNEAYTGQLILTLDSGTTYKSDAFFFVTKGQNTNPLELMLAVCASAIIGFMVGAALVAVGSCAWRHRVRTSAPVGGFVNNTFEILNISKNIPPAANPGVI